MKKALFVGVCLFAIGSVLAFGTPVQACLTPWEGDEEVSKKPSPLHAAIEKGDLLQVRKALKNGADVNQKQHSVCYGHITNHGSTALARAISFGHKEIASYLIEQGADIINISDYHIGYERVAFVNDTSSVEKETQAEKLEFPEGLDQGASTLFSYANTPEMVHFVANVFKEKGLLTQMVNHENREVNNALFSNIYACKEELIKALLSHGIKFSQNSGALEKAVLEGRFYKEKGGKLTGVISESCPSSFIDLLMEQDLEVKDSKKVKEVFLKALYEYPNLAKKMIETPAYQLDLNGQYDYHNLTPIEVAILSKNKDLATFLIQKGADVNKDAQGNTLLYLAVQNKDKEMVLLLLENGVDVNKDAQGNTPLHLAVQNSDKEMALLLLENGVDVNVQNRKGKSALHFDFVLKTDLLDKVLALGGDVNLADIDGNKPYHLAKRFSNPDVLAKLQPEDISKAKPCFGADVNEKDQNAQTLLHKVETVDLALCLVRAGADENAVDLNGQTPLMTQIIQKNWSVVRYLLDIKTTNFNHQDNLGNTFLHYYYLAGENVFYSFSKLEQINVQNKEGKTPLHYFVEKNMDDGPFLYEAKKNRSLVDFNVKDNLGRTPLFYLNRKSPIIRFFDLTVQDNLGNTALVYIDDSRRFEDLYHAGARFGDVVNLNDKELLDLNEKKKAQLIFKIQFLLSKNDLRSLKTLIVGMMNSDLKAEYSSLLLEYASRYKQKELYEILKEVDINAKGKEDKTLFQKTLSSQNPNIKLIETLLDTGADVNEQDEMGETPLHKALATQNPKEIVSLLIKYGADVNIKDKEGRLPIHKVLSSQMPDIRLLTLLLKNGAGVNEQDEMGETPLHKALATQYPNEIISLLIKHGADVNIKDKEGRLPIHKVLSSQKPDIRLLTLLLENGADVNAKDKNGETPLQKALKLPHSFHFSQVLLKHGAVIENDVPQKKSSDEKTPDNAQNMSMNAKLIFPTMLVSRDTSYISMLLEKGLDVNSKDNQGNSLLHKAIFYQNKNLLDLLIQKGADVNVKDNRGETPLILAIKFHRLDIVRLLIEKGADVNVKDGEGFSFLYHLILLNKLDLIELAFQKGADVNIKSRNGETPLISAIKFRKLEVIKLLLEKGSDSSLKDESGKTALDYCMAWNKCAEIEALIVSKNH